MAVSRYSSPFQVHGPADVVGVDRLDNTIGYLDQSMNQNIVAVESEIDGINNLDLIRPQDIEYRNKRIGQLVSELNGHASLNLADPKVGMRLRQEVRSVAKDPTLMTALQSTKNARSLVDRYAKMKENPKLLPFYSEINEWHDMQEYRKWVNGETNSMSKSTPTFKFDIDKAVGEELKKLAPKEYSAKDGLYIVNGQIRSMSDLQSIALGYVNQNPEAQAQLIRNALYMNKDKSPAAVYNDAIEAQSNEIKTAKDDLTNYKTKVLDASISDEERASINERINELGKNIPQAEAKLEGLRAQYINSDFADVDSLKVNAYASTWVKSVSQPYVVNKMKLAANQPAIFAQKRLDDFTKEQIRTNLTREQGALNRQAQLQGQILSAQTQLGKENKTFNVDDFLRTGNMEITDLGSTGSGTAGLVTLPTVTVGGTEIDAISELNTKVGNLANENKNILTNTAISIIRKSDPTLAGKLDAFNKSHSSLKGFKDKGMSPAQIKLLQEYDQLLVDSTDPAKLRDNPALGEYGEAANQITLNLLQIGSLQGERTKAERELFEEMWANKEYAGTWNQYQARLKGEAEFFKKGKKLNETVQSVGAGRVVVPDGANRNSNTDYIKRINEKLRNSTMYDQFYTAKAIAEEDKFYNDGKGAGKSMIREIVGKTGVTGDDGINYSINGQRNGEKVFRDDIPNAEIRVDAIIPNADQVKVSVMVPDTENKGKMKVDRTGIMQLNPSDMKDLMGRNSNNVVRSIHPSLRNGVMVDQAGSPLYLNLNGSIPDMTGNLRYRFYDAGRGDRSIGVSINKPVNGIFQDKHPQSLIFSGEDAHLKATQALTQLYQQTYESLKSQLPPNTSHEQISKMALEKLYEIK